MFAMSIAIYSMTADAALTLMLDNHEDAAHICMIVACIAWLIGVVGAFFAIPLAVVGEAFTSNLQ
jgi:hypothetical protein